MSIEAIVAIIVPLIALCFTALSFRRTENHDTAASATERATMTADIRYIRSSIDEIKLENKSIQKDVSDMAKKIVEVESSVREAHRRIDDISKGGHHE